MRRPVLSVALTIACAVSALAADQPRQRRPGLWQLTMTIGESPAPPVVLEICVDAATSATLDRLGAGVDQTVCSKLDRHDSADTVTVDSECTFGASHGVTHATITYGGDTEYRVETETRYAPPLLGKSVSTMTQTGRWTGACGPTLAPGDVVTPDGGKVNLGTLFQGRPATTLPPAQPAPPPPAPSRTVAVPAMPTPAPTPRQARPPGAFRVQIAAATDDAGAHKTWDDLRKAHPDLLGSLSLSVVRADLGAKGIFYRVQAGPLPDRAAAEQLCDRLKALRTGCIVLQAP